MSSKKSDHLLLRVAYSGESFSGFQWQKDQLSVQGFMEERLAQFFGRRQRIQFSSRTDVGVSALDQCVVLPHFKSFLLNEKPQLLRAFRVSLNAFFDERVSVWQTAWLSSEFNFKKDILWKEYRYLIFNSRVLDPRRPREALWIKKPLQVERMRKELQSFVGEHDFSAFAKSSGKSAQQTKRGSIRRVFQADLKCRAHERWPDSQWIEIRVRAEGFLHKMVRNMVGSLVDIGMGNRVASIRQILQSRSREQAGRAALPHGLTLWETKIHSRRVDIFEG